MRVRSTVFGMVLINKFQVSCEQNLIGKEIIVCAISFRPTFRGLPVSKNERNPE